MFIERTSLLRPLYLDAKRPRFASRYGLGLHGGSINISRLRRFKTTGRFRTASGSDRILKASWPDCTQIPSHIQGASQIRSLPLAVLTLCG